MKFYQRWGLLLFLIGLCLALADYFQFTITGETLNVITGIFILTFLGLGGLLFLVGEE